VFVRRQGNSPADAQDLTQEFFAWLLFRNFVSLAQPERGKFRWFLLASLRHFLSNEWDRAKVERRGGGCTFISLDQTVAEGRYLQELGHDLTPDKLYERTWAVTVIQQVREQLRHEYADTGKVERFDVLDQLLPGEQGELTRADAAIQLGLSAGGLRTQVHRLRRRYGELIRTEIAHTVADPNEIEEELRHLIEVMSG